VSEQTTKKDSPTVHDRVKRQAAAGELYNAEVAFHRAQWDHWEQRTETSRQAWVNARARLKEAQRLAAHACREEHWH